MGDKHPRKTPEARLENGRGASPQGAPPELRVQIAALAEQVRRLSAHDGETAAAVAIAAAPPASVGAVQAPPPAVPAEPAGTRAGLNAVDVIAMAERAAAQIRARAEREAERIRADRRRPTADAAAVLLAVLRRQRAALAVLAAETERLEQSAKIIRGQLRVFEDEVAAVHEILGAPPRPSVFQAFSEPAA